MTGASCALRLMELGVRNVVLIDARGIGEGTVLSSTNTHCYNN